MWVAYLNLENTYGSPPDEAVMKLFQRALQHVDQKKLYLAMLTILESTKKVTMAGSQIATDMRCKTRLVSNEWFPYIYVHACQNAGKCLGGHRDTKCIGLRDIRAIGD